MGKTSHYWHTHDRQLAGRGVTLLVALWIVATAQTGVAQPASLTCTPEQQQALGGCDPQNPPSRFTLYRDDELAVFQMATNLTNYWIQEFSPNPDYQFPAGPTSNPFVNAPQVSGIENLFLQHTVTRGRFVEPSRDAAVALVKVSVTAASVQWAVEEMSFPGTAATVPPYIFTTNIVGLPNAPMTPGAIAAGDLDQAVDGNGNYHDEVAIVYETFPGGGATYLTLTVIDYAVAPGA